MTYSKTSCWLWGVLLLGVILWGTSSAVPAHAQTNNPNITLQFTVGFDGLRKGQAWTPVQISVANNGPAIEGQIVVYGGNLNNRTVRYTAPISLPTQSSKRIFLNTYLSSNTVNVQLLNAQGDVVAQERIVRVSAIDSEGLLYGVVSSNPDALDILNRVTAGRPQAAVAFLQLTDLPPDPIGWRMLDMLILSDVDTNELSAAQRTALRSWVEAGGQLVVAGGANWQKTTSALADLLPVEPTGIQSVADLPSLAQAVGQPFRDAGPYTITTSRLRDGELLYREGSLPILAKRPHGLGHVFFLALDPQFAPLEAWAGREAFWASVAEYIPPPPVWAQDFRDPDSVTYAIEVFPNLRLPSAVGLFAFLCLYVVAIGPLNYGVLVWLNKREWAWVSVPLVVLLFSGVAYAIGLATLGNRAMINQMTMIHGQMGASQGVAHTAVSLYSPARTGYTLQFPATTQIRPLTQSFASDTEMLVEREATLQVQLPLVDVGQVVNYAVVDHLPLPALQGQVVAQEQGNNGRLSLEITLTNHSQTDFENGMILIDRHAIGVPLLAAGQTATYTYVVPSGPAAEVVRQAAVGLHTAEPAVSASYDGPLETYYTHLLGSSSTYYYYYSSSDDPIAYSRYQFLSGMRSYYSSTATGTFPRGRITFVAWSDTAAFDIELLDRRATTDGTTLYFLEIPFRP